MEQFGGDKELILNSTISALLVKSEVSNCCKKFVHIKMELLSYMNKKTLNVLCLCSYFTVHVVACSSVIWDKETR